MENNSLFEGASLKAPLIRLKENFNVILCKYKIQYIIKEVGVKNNEDFDCEWVKVDEQVYICPQYENFKYLLVDNGDGRLDIVLNCDYSGFLKIKVNDIR